jgi:hypothetical protein
MMRFLNKSMFIVAIISLFAPFSSGFALSSGKTASTGKQIVFILDDASSKFTSVKIQGYDQKNNGQLKTWLKQDPAGFKMAYTKNWWWAENFVQIDFVIRDDQNKKSYSQTCLIDVLEQPNNSSRVEIIYTKANGCIGGEAGNAQDPIQKAIIPVRDSFTKVEKYAAGLNEDFNVDVFQDVFMETLYTELNVIGCVGGVALAFQTGGYSFFVARPIIAKTCLTTAEKMGKLFNQP